MECDNYLQTDIRYVAHVWVLTAYRKNSLQGIHSSLQYFSDLILLENMVWKEKKGKRKAWKRKEGNRA